MEAQNNKPSFWAKCAARIKKAAPYIPAVVAVATPFIDCMKHSAKNRSNVKAQQRISDIKFNDWVRRWEYRNQHPFRNYGRRRHGRR